MVHTFNPSTRRQSRWICGFLFLFFFICVCLGYIASSRQTRVTRWDAKEEKKKKDRHINLADLTPMIQARERLRLDCLKFKARLGRRLSAKLRWDTVSPSFKKHTQQPSIVWEAEAGLCNETPSQKKNKSRVMVAHAFNFSSWVAKAGNIWVRGHPGPHRFQDSQDYLVSKPKIISKPTCSME